VRRLVYLTRAVRDLEDVFDDFADTARI